LSPPFTIIQRTAGKRNNILPVKLFGVTQKFRSLRLVRCFWPQTRYNRLRAINALEPPSSGIITPSEANTCRPLAAPCVLSGGSAGSMGLCHRLFCGRSGGGSVSSTRSSVDPGASRGQQRYFYRTFYPVNCRPAPIRQHHLCVVLECLPSLVSFRVFQDEILPGGYMAVP
jgi:hypothetical protein